MVNIRFGNYEQFVKYFQQAPDNIKRILSKAHPDFAARLTNDYINATKKITQVTNKAKDTASQAVKAITQKSSNTSKINPNLDDAFDTLYGKGKEATETVAKKGKGIKVPKVKVPGILKGAGRLVTWAAPVQGLIEMHNNPQGSLERARGATMFGSGALGLATANPWLLGLASALAVGSAVAEPAGNAIGDWIYKPKDVIYNPNYTRLDITHNLKGEPYTPEEQAKIIAFNDAQDAKIAQQYGQAMVPYGMQTQPVESTEQVGVIPANYSQSTTGISSSPNYTGANFPNVQNAQEGGLNIIQDILQGNQIQPVLNSIVEPVNYSNEYLKAANNISNQLQGIGQEEVVNTNPYNQIRGYSDINSQLAPVPNQPQGIREDVLPDYLRVMEGIRGKQDGLNYANILAQYNKATEADARQNSINQMINSFGAFGQPAQRAPIYYVGAKGDLRGIELDQPSAVTPLPTNTTSNTDKLMGQLKIQQAEQADTLAQQKLYNDMIKAQQEREDMMAQASALAERFGGRPEMYMNKDVIQSLLSQTINPNIQAQANVMEAIGKAPTQDQLKAAEQYRSIAGNLDQTNLQKQWDAQMAQLNSQAKLLQTQLEQDRLDKRTAATLASNWAIAQAGQLQQNYRAMIEDARARDLAEYGRGTQFGVADIYANARGNSGKQPQTVQDIQNQILIEGVKSGTPIPQLLKYMQVIGTNRGLTAAEEAEMNR